MLQLTDAGQAFLQKAYLTISLADEAVLVARKAQRGESGHLALGFGSSFLYNILPQVIRKFRERCPDVALNCMALRTDRQIERLLKGQIDVKCSASRSRTGS